MMQLNRSHQFITVLLALAVAGCITGRQHPAATQPATAVDTRTAQPLYWFDQPAVVHVTAKHFDPLWNACRRATEGDGFIIDRTDYRDGLLWTMPLVSKQFFELWRNDVVDVHDLNQSSLGTVRRTVRWQIRRNNDATFFAEPKVLVERFSEIERRITAVAQYRDIFSVRLIDVDREVEQQGAAIPAAWWYSIGRDHELEKQLARAVEQSLRH